MDAKYLTVPLSRLSPDIDCFNPEAVKCLNYCPLSENDRAENKVCNYILQLYEYCDINI